jgi:hypothetical protein
VQLRQPGNPMVAGNTYTLDFWARASAARNLEVMLQRTAAPYTVYLRRTVALDTTWQRYLVSFTATSSDPDVQVEFNLAQATGQVWLDGVALTDTNLLQNGSLEGVGGSWYQPWSLRNELGASLTQDSSTKALGSASARVSLTQSSPSIYLVQLRQTGKAQAAGRTYAIAFWAKAASARPIELRVQQSAAPNATYFKQTVMLGTSWQQYVFAYTAGASNPDVFLSFNLAQTTATVWLDDVAFVELP